MKQTKVICTDCKNEATITEDEDGYTMTCNHCKYSHGISKEEAELLIKTGLTGKRAISRTDRIDKPFGKEAISLEEKEKTEPEGIVKEEKEEKENGEPIKK